MKRFKQRSRVCVLAIILGFTITSCFMQGENLHFVSPDFQPLTATEPDAATKAVVQPASRALPLSFEGNQGQAPAGGDYLSHGPGYLLSLTATEATFTLQKPPAQSEASVTPDKRAARPLGKPRSLRRSQPEPERVTLHLHLVGANPHAPVSGLNELPGRVNYISGQDSVQWHTNIPTYAKVKYESVYPGVDLIYYGNSQRRLEYDFHVAPGADPANIKLRFDGVDTLEVDSAGELVLHTTGGEIRQHRPQIYQEVAGGPSDHLRGLHDDRHPGS